MKCDLYERVVRRERFLAQEHGPWLNPSIARTKQPLEALLAHRYALVQFGAMPPPIALIDSWLAVRSAQCKTRPAEALAELTRTEMALRRWYAQDQHALAINLAAQALCVDAMWIGRKSTGLVRLLLQEAFHLSEQWDGSAADRRVIVNRYAAVLSRNGAGKMAEFVAKRGTDAAQS